MVTEWYIQLLLCNVVITAQLKVDSHTLDVSAAETVGEGGDDKDLLPIKKAIQVEVIERIKSLEERIAAIEKKLSIE